MVYLLLTPFNVGSNQNSSPIRDRAWIALPKAEMELSHLKSYKCSYILPTFDRIPLEELLCFLVSCKLGYANVTENDVLLIVMWADDLKTPN